MSSIEPQTGFIGWLRIVHESSESRLQVGLFTTTTQYEPVAFTFGCLSLRQNLDEQAITSLIRTLIASMSMGTNELIVGVSEDVSSAVWRELSATQALVRVPVASIDRDSPSPRDEAIDRWLAMIDSDDQFVTPRLMARIFEGRERPYEPLIRTAKALDIVVEDSHVRELLADANLQLVLSVPKPKSETNHNPADPANVQISNTACRSGFGHSCQHPYRERLLLQKTTIPIGGGTSCRFNETG